MVVLANTHLNVLALKLNLFADAGPADTATNTAATAMISSRLGHLFMLTPSARCPAFTHGLSLGKRRLAVPLFTSRAPQRIAQPASNFTMTPKN